MLLASGTVGWPPVRRHLGGVVPIPPSSTSITVRAEGTGFNRHKQTSLDQSLALLINPGRAHADNDYYNQVVGGCPTNSTGASELGGLQPIQDLWGHTNETNEGPQRDLANSLSQCSNYTNAWTNNPTQCKYEDELFTERVQDIINAHDLTGNPLFLYWAPHIGENMLEMCAGAAASKPHRRSALPHRSRWYMLDPKPCLLL